MNTREITVREEIEAYRKIAEVALRMVERLLRETAELRRLIASAEARGAM